ncbi:hypothetical protein OEZ49_22630 [Ruegeria sp. WL0004]|uniref:Sarcosine oxidase subunit gamma n=1 Tax=Ruegeria marisflavi TaxID=2984152 RepID=A0ABT2WXX5_9RHOB|nr:hypothetical protein [Ruegeria sp. WL0004]MCU9840547.1 hypothetical protein [Ruegeria sp. WL0004]
MFDLQKTPACGNTLPARFGDCRATEAEARHITSLAPRNGQRQALSDALREDFGFGLPERGAVHAANGGFVCPFGHAHYLMVSDRSVEQLASFAHMTDQSSAWVTVELVGTSATEILARLAPVDLNPGAFPVNSILQTEVARIHAILIRFGLMEFRIMAPRSMAKSLAREVTRAARNVESRRNVHA